MGIKLDWEIEAEQSQVRNTGEEEESKRRRRKARARLLFLVVFVLLLFVAVAGGIVLRLRYVDQQVEQALRDTVEAEVTALRIGDRSAFLAIQRSATEDWLLAQERRFDEYQQLKLTHDVQLTGRVLDVTVEGKRARARIEEIIDGVPYARVWFYWSYDDGWHHVPPDYTFWGDARTIDTARLQVRYHSVDEPLARALAAQVGEWLRWGCEALACTNLPEILFEIVPGEVAVPAWAPANPWAMQVPSPLADRARLDQPLQPELREALAGLLAQRLVAQAMNNLQPEPWADAAFLRDSAVSWLAARFAQQPTTAYLVDSLAQRFGEGAVGRTLRLLLPGSDIATISQVTGDSIDRAGLDWRDFLAWRLNLEQQVIAASNQTAFLMLYDTTNELARNQAYSRFNAGITGETYSVVSVTPDSEDGVPLLRARVQVGNQINLREEEVLFRLVNGAWKRAN